MAEEQEVAVIPLVEEQLEVTKRQVETGRVRVRILVDEREETLPAELVRDAVEVRRVARGVPVTELPTVRLEGGVTIIPVVEEQIVVEKRLVLVEEIHIHRKSETVQETIPVRIRAERAEIEREEAGGAAGMADAPADGGADVAADGGAGR
ncbi:MAG TPA: YsnF/AvaK domain-containing protein [Allosphingosinicella sp.]|jgi:uncharacterized protein (TIGR02271 family)